MPISNLEIAEESSPFSLPTGHNTPLSQPKITRTGHFLGKVLRIRQPFGMNLQPFR